MGDMECPSCGEGGKVSDKPVVYVRIEGVHVKEGGRVEISVEKPE